MNSKLTIAVLLIGIAISVQAQEIAIIPQPSKITVKTGSFTLNKGCTVSFDKKNKELAQIGGLFNSYLKTIYGIETAEKGNGKQIKLAIDSKLVLQKEGYQLAVTPEGITITGGSGAGVFYGVQSLKQLLPPEPGKSELQIPAVAIEDQPRFGWRGNMLDCGRHFFPVSFIKKYIDILAMYKLNTFHWHLTEDQGWRIEIKKYPKLTELSHWREQTVLGHNTPEYDGIGYGGFYTQEQIKEIVKYAAERYITVVPEIEMPGHSSAALAAYPNLGCTGGPYKVRETWGVFKEVYCAGKEETYTFLQDVLDEVCELFPSQFIHIGGDECPKESWKNCPDCQKKIMENGLKDEHELQSYLITRMDKYLTSKGRRLIGWDEILEGGLAPQATVMSWRGIDGGIAAAKQFHDVVMSPTTYMYFDYYQSEDKDKEPLAIGGFLPLDKVYGYEPIPSELKPEEAKYILGVQANLWTEYIATTSKAEYMLMPRLHAMSEVAWSAPANKNFENFEKRLAIDYKRLEMLGINYRDHRK